MSFHILDTDIVIKGESGSRSPESMEAIASGIQIWDR